MSRKKYPNFPLNKALEHINIIYDADRTSVITREDVARHLGYKGISGASTSTISTLNQYGLLQKSGPAGIRVSQTAVDILHPENQDQKQTAINEAVFSPPLFKELWEHFENRIPSETALNTYLMRNGFNQHGIDAVIASFAPTVEMYKEAEDNPSPQESHKDTHEATTPTAGVPTSPTTLPAGLPAYIPHDADKTDQFEEWFRVKVGAEKLITINYQGEGEVGPKEIQKIIAILEVQKTALED